MTRFYILFIRHADEKPFFLPAPALQDYPRLVTAFDALFPTGQGR